MTIKLFPSPSIHYKESQASQKLNKLLLHSLSSKKGQAIILVCIGTDRSTGDSLGPLIGSKLQEKNISSFHIFGTLDEPVHALNLSDTLLHINETFKNPFIIGVDACLGNERNIGKITLAKGPVYPGAALNKNLPAVGNIHITGTVNTGGYMDFLVLQNTRLSIVMNMAEIIANSIFLTEQKMKLIS